MTILIMASPEILLTLKLTSMWGLIPELASPSSTSHPEGISTEMIFVSFLCSILASVNALMTLIRCANGSLGVPSESQETLKQNVGKKKAQFQIICKMQTLCIPWKEKPNIASTTRSYSSDSNEGSSSSLKNVISSDFSYTGVRLY